ncbi:MAG: hypothetical protein FWB95_03015 [Treponema sp.]|nr:hypothetical protein [Treponema sp.]
MKNIKYLLILVFFLYVSAAADAQLFKPFKFFRVIKTEHFDIIFPKESEPSARLLSEYADNLYKDLTSILGIEVRVRIPVTFTAHTDMFNGYYAHLPRPHIVLYDTPMDLEWTVYENNLKGLFLHELVHAVTLNTGNRFYQFMRRVFGYWASPAYLNAPLFMIEGATVSFESLTGFGRANDPLIKQKLRQAIYENKFLEPFKTSGFYDLPDQSGIYYDYGGLFSAWLQKEYGMEKYSELWKAIGSDRFIKFSLFVYRSRFYDAFNKVYGIYILDAWETFRLSLALDDIEEKPGSVLPAQYRFLKETKRAVSKMAAYGDNIYILESAEDKILVYNSQTDVIRSFNTNSFYSYDLDISDCGTKLLVSGYNSMGEMFKAVVIEQDAETGKKTGRTIHSFYKARYFRDGAIGIKSELHNNNIVYTDFNGNEEILFKGNETLMFSGPQVLDNDRIVFIAAKHGIRRLFLFNYASRELFKIEESTGNGNYWHYMRGLNVLENKLLFSYNSDDRMYKLASVDFNSMRAVFNSRDFSGGVFNPVSVNGEIFYSGNFFAGDEVLRFPETADSISGTLINIIMVKQDANEYGLVAKAGWEEPSDPPMENSSSQIPSKPFLSIAYMNPFNLWLPVPFIRYTEEFPYLSLDGGGIFSLLTDPSDRNMITFFLFYDAVYRMARIQDFKWQSTVPGFPVTLVFNDKVETNLSFPYRITQLGLSANFSHTPGRFTYGFSVGGGYSRAALYDGASSAYNWKETSSFFYYSAAFSFSNRLQRRYEMFGNGFSFSLRGANIVSDFKPRVEGLFTANVEKRIPFFIALYGAYDKSGMDMQGASKNFSEAIYAAYSSEEYLNSNGPELNWISGCEIGIGVFSLEIQRNFSHVYYNRFRGILSIRNVLYDSQGDPGAEGVMIGDLHLAQSLVFKLGLVVSAIPIKMSPLFLEPYLWGAWKFSNTITRNESFWHIGVGINLQF